MAYQIPLFPSRVFFIRLDSFFALLESLIKQMRNPAAVGNILDSIRRPLEITSAFTD